jgi:ribonuclease HI
MFLSHYRAGTGAVLVETREERRLLESLLAELPPTATVCTVAAPSGALRDARTGKAEQGKAGLAAAYQWASEAPGRVVLVYDWHTLINAPVQWRALIDALPALRAPIGARPKSTPTLPNTRPRSPRR